jgi:methylmalonyl-CoA mutase
VSEAPTDLNAFPWASEAQWRAAAEAALKGKSLETLYSRTDDGLVISPLEPGRPDALPIVSKAGWIHSARVDHPHASASAAQAIDDLMNGADGLSIVHSGSLLARGFGLEAGDIAALGDALAGVELDLIHVRLDLQDSSVARSQCFAELVLARRYDPARMMLSFGLDPIGSMAARREPADAWASVAASMSAHVASLRRTGFRGPFFVSDGRLWHEAGATEAQELGAMLASAISSVRLQADAGVALADAFSGVSFTLAVDADQLLSIAKLRALRKLWLSIAQACGVALLMIEIHAETAFRMLAKRDVSSNILRNTLAGFAAIVGGATSLSILPHTCAHGLPDRHARRLARNTQNLLRQEAELARVADPVAGSGAIEMLTEQLADAAWSVFQTFEAENGTVPGLVRHLADGRLQAMMQEAHAVRLAAFADKKRHLVGVTAFNETIDPPVDVEWPAPALQGAWPSHRIAETFETGHAT